MEITANNDDRRYSISEVSRLTGVPAHTIRFWERDFWQFLKPDRTQGKQRRYTRRDVEVIEQIRHLRYEKRHTIAGTINELGGVPGEINDVEIERIVKDITDMIKDRILVRMKDY